MQPTLFIPQLCCMPRSNPAWSNPAWSNQFAQKPSTRGRVCEYSKLSNKHYCTRKTWVKGSLEMYLCSFQTIQIWNDCSLDASSTLVCSRCDLLFIRNLLSYFYFGQEIRESESECHKEDTCFQISLQLKIHRIAPYLQINKRIYTLFFELMAWL